MGSCVLVMLIKGEGLFLMNVGDNCAMLAMRWERNLMNILGKATMQNLQQSKDEIIREPNSHVMDGHPAQR